MVVEGSDPEYRAVTVGRALLEAMRARVKEPAERPAAAFAPEAPRLAQPVDNRDVLTQLDLSQALAKKRFDVELSRQQRRLSLLTRHPKFREHTAIIVFEGMDAAGKGGAIRRIAGSKRDHRAAQRSSSRRSSVSATRSRFETAYASCSNTLPPSAGLAFTNASKRSRDSA
jgi:polyphosphate kinase 2 (PPK2 family)